MNDNLQLAECWAPLQEKKVHCLLCHHFCRLAEEENGICGVRQNIGGELYTKVADRVAAINVDPIEKKPLYHFLPGTRTFSFGTMGCNFRCSFCQNYTLSQPPKDGQPIAGEKTTPSQLVNAALRQACRSISYTYSEPTVFYELVRAVSSLAVKNSLRNIIVSNGYMSKLALKGLKDLLHAANIDFKAMSEDFYEKLCGAKLKPVLQNIVNLVGMGVWVELTTLVIPEHNDSDQEFLSMAKWIKNELGPLVPWHLSRYRPCYKMRTPGPTPPETLLRAKEIALSEGLKYVYIGNMAGPNLADTLCPNCQAVLIKRHGWETDCSGLDGKVCRSCKTPVEGLILE